MRRELRWLDGRRLARSFARMLVAGAVMYGVARPGIYFTGTGASALERAGILAGVGGLSLAAYLGVAFLLRAEELRPLAALLRRPAPAKRRSAGRETL
jgi:hypothetical protein